MSPKHAGEEGTLYPDPVRQDGLRWPESRVQRKSSEERERKGKDGSSLWKLKCFNVSFLSRSQERARSTRVARTWRSSC